MSSRRLFALALVLSFHLIVTAILVGQADTASVTGLITDPQGKVVPGAEVLVTNQDTGVSVHQTTNEAGLYVVSGLKPGRYRVSFSKEGFRRVDLTDVVLNVQDVLSRNLQLQPGSVESSITVAADAATINTTDGSVSTVVDRQFVANIPLNGRTLHALIQLTPGVVLATAQGRGATGSAQFNVNGQRATSNYFMVDGVSANTGISAAQNGLPEASGAGQTLGATVLGGTNSLVSLDALQEFRIETSTFAPEFGRTTGGQISLLTRAGTNQFHGSASYYLRNEVLDANDWFANANRQPKPKERQNLFGGVLGGPIKRDRLFFFASYEELRLEQPKAQVVTVPTVALRAQAVTTLGPYLNALPLPNGRDFGNGTAEFAASYSDPGKFNIFALRLDGRMANSLTGFLRISHAPSEAKTRGASLSTVTSVSAVNNAFTGGLTWVPGTRLTSDLRVNWTRNRARSFSDLEAFGGAVVPGVSDVFLPGRDPSTARTLFSVVSSGSFDWGAGSSDVQRQFNTVGTVVWVVRSHQLKFGVDYRRILPLIGNGGALFESLSVTTTQLAAGVVASYLLTSIDPVPRKAIFSNLSLFAQDTWHTTRRLTLTYGLRFERVPPPSEATGRLPRTLLGIETDPPQNPGLAPIGTPLFRSRFGEWAPRFGIAYQLSARPGWEMAVRGGVGIFYDLGQGIIADSFDAYPFIARKSAANVTLPLTSAIRTPPTLGVDPPQQLFMLDPNLRLPYTVQWNATWEQVVGAGQTLTIGYVGAAARRLLILQKYNGRKLADFATAASTTVLNVQRNLGSSSYDALQLQYQRRLRRGVQALASYTLARSRDNTSADDASAPPASQATLLTQNFGPSDFDVRHVLSAAVTYDLPKLSGPTVLRLGFNDWGLDLLVRYQSAFPVNLIAGAVSFPDGTFYNPRPDLVSGQPLYINDPTVPGGRRFNITAFAAPPSNRQGNFPRNGIRGFPASQVDLALRREFRLGEKVRLQLRGELFNVFNHPNFGAPDNFIGDGLFGQPTQMLNRSLGGLNALYQMGGPRSGQLAAKLIF